jgi:hypothetical protein
VVAVFANAADAFAARNEVAATAGAAAAGITIEGGPRAAERMTGARGWMSALARVFSEDEVLGDRIIERAQAGATILTMPRDAAGGAVGAILARFGAIEAYRTGAWVTERLHPVAA